jgi:hypothetical protein
MTEDNPARYTDVVRPEAEKVNLERDKLTTLLHDHGLKLQDLVGKYSLSALQRPTVTRATAEYIRARLEELLRENGESPGFTLSLEELLVPDPSQAHPDPESPPTLISTGPSKDDRKRKRLRIVIAVTVIAALAVFITAWVTRHLTAKPDSDSSASHIREPKTNDTVEPSTRVCLSPGDEATNKYVVVTANNKAYYSFGPVKRDCLRINIGEPADVGTQFDIFIAAPEGTMNTGEITQEDLPKVFYPPVKVTRK